ncbi:MAG: N-acetylglucosamine kinase [Opitutales bacterium]
MTTWIAGVDAGGTHTVAVACNLDTGELRETETGPGNPWSAGSLAAGTAIEEALAGVLALAGVHPHELAAAVLGVAGNGRLGLPPDFAQHIEAWGLPARTRVTSDLVIAAASTLGREPGVHLIAGTGSVVGVQHAPGRLEQIGGWGWFLGDPGSAFDLGHRALRWWAGVSDGLAGDAILEARLQAATGEQSLADVAERCTRPDTERAWIGRLGAQVPIAAEAGSAVARALLDASLEGLAWEIGGARDRLEGSARVWCGLSGGMARSPEYLSLLRVRLETLAGRFLGLRVASRPVHGALLLAESTLDRSPMVEKIVRDLLPTCLTFD